MTGVVEINVGGVVWTTTWETLALREGMLRILHMRSNDMQGQLMDKEGRLFLDRNGKAFGVVMNVLRTGQALVPDDVGWAEAQAELDFFFPGQRLLALTSSMALATSRGLWPRFWAISDVLFRRAQAFLRVATELAKKKEDGQGSLEFTIEPVKKNDGPGYFLRTGTYGGGSGPMVLEMHCGCDSCWFDWFLRDCREQHHVLDIIARALGSEYALFRDGDIKLFYFPSLER